MRKGVISSVFLVTIFSVLTRLLAFIFKVYISRNLGAEVVGIYQTSLQIFFMIMSISSSGIPIVLSRYIAKDTSDNSPKYLTSALIISLVSAVITILLTITLYPLFNKILIDKRAVIAFYIILPSLISSTIYNVLRSWFWGRKSFLPFSTTELLEEILRITFTIIFTSSIVNFDNVTGLAIGFLVSDIICAILLIFFFVLSKGRFKKPIEISGIFRSSVPLTLTRFFSGITSVISALIIPYMLIKTGLTKTQAYAMYGEVYGMAMPLLLAPMTLINSMSIVLIPEIASNNNNTKKIESSIVVTLSICALFTILFIPFAEELTILIFNDKLSGTFLKYSTLLLYPIGINHVSTSILNSLGYEKRTFIHFVIGTILMIISLLIFPKIIGIYAITVSLFLSSIATCVLNLQLINKKIGIFNNMKKPIFAILLSIPEIILSMLLKNLFINVNSVIMIIIAGGIPMLLYAISLIVFDVLPKTIVLRHLRRKSS